MITRYLVQTPRNTAYTGSVLGIPIVLGRGILDAQMINPKLGRTFEEVVHELQQMEGYELLPLTSEGDAQLLQAMNVAVSATKARDQRERETMRGKLPVLEMEAKASVGLNPTLEKATPAYTGLMEPDEDEDEAPAPTKPVVIRRKRGRRRTVAAAVASEAGEISQ